MDMKAIIANMWPLWVLGVAMIIATLSTEYRSMLKIKPKSVLKWVGFLALVAAFRIASWKFLSGPLLGDKANLVASIPWQMTFTVFWEDAAHTLPVAILGKFLGDGKWAKVAYYAAIAFMMISFGLGHVYQGYFAAAMLSLYIPYTIKLAKEEGFGTIMICHILYDLATILTIRYMMGLM